jgi:hypothetical protein
MTRCYPLEQKTIGMRRPRGDRRWVLIRPRVGRMAQQSAAGAAAIVSIQRSADALPETMPLSYRAAVVEQSPGHSARASCSRHGSFNRFHIVAIRRSPKRT